jgi:hypothetical protein
MLKELLMSSIKGEVKKKHFCIGRNFSCLMTSECWLSHIADSSFSCYYPVALSDTLGHDANEDRVLVSRLIVIWDLTGFHMTITPFYKKGCQDKYLPIGGKPQEKWSCRPAPVM